MDLYCPLCAEPCDADELHDVPGASFAQAYARFRRTGCAVFGAACNSDPDTQRAEVARVVMDALGDDVDAAAAELADLLTH